MSKYEVEAKLADVRMRQEELAAEAALLEKFLKQLKEEAA